MIPDSTTWRRSSTADVAAVAAAEWWFMRRSLLYGRLGAFALAAVLFGLFQYAWSAIYHFTFSGYSASSDVLLSMLGGGPSSDASRIGDDILWLLAPSVVLLGFDVRARDELARIDGPLDTRPTSNLALVLGRLLALVLSHWILLACALLLCHLVGFHPWRDAVEGLLQMLAALAPFSGARCCCSSLSTPFQRCSSGALLFPCWCRCCAAGSPCWRSVSRSRRVLGGSSLRATQLAAALGHSDCADSIAVGDRNGHA